jgi:hypothetical protein
MTSHILTCWIGKHRAIVQVINRIIRCFTWHLQRTRLICIWLVHILAICFSHYLLIIVYFALKVFFDWFYSSWRDDLWITSFLKRFSWTLSKRYFAVVLLLFWQVLIILLPLFLKVLLHSRTCKWFLLHDIFVLFNFVLTAFEILHWRSVAVVHRVL